MRTTTHVISTNTGGIYRLESDGKFEILKPVGIARDFADSDVQWSDIRPMIGQSTRTPTGQFDCTMGVYCRTVFELDGVWYLENMFGNQGE